MEEALEELLGQGKPSHNIYSGVPHIRPSDDDLVAMYLTDKRNGIDRQLDDHEELEVLLESFSKQVEEIVNEAENMEVTAQPALPNITL